MPANCSITNRKYNPILVAIHPDTKTEFGGAAIDDFFEGTLVIGSTTYPLLQVFPKVGGYTQSRKKSQPPLVRHTGGVTTFPERAELSISLQTEGIDARVQGILLKTAQISDSSNTLITILDYQSVEPEDLITFIAAGTGRPYSQRSGRIVVESVSPIVGRDISVPMVARNGMKFKFVQLSLVTA